MLRLFAEQDEVRVVDDQFGAPTSSRYLAHATVRVIAAAPRATASGVYHCTPSGVTSWHGFASLVHALDTRPERRCTRVVAVSTADYPTAARRPRWSVLDSSRAEGAFKIVPRPWEELVRETMRGFLSADGSR
jgi:dTDP-4-dehydrorhamnose reductase